MYLYKWTSFLYVRDVTTIPLK